MQKETSTLPIGTVLETDSNRYTIVETLKGEGKHGVSFRGEAQGSQPVFIKLLKLPLNPVIQEVKGRIDRLSKNFHAEHQHADRLKHINGIAHVLDHGSHVMRIESDKVEIPFLVQEYVEGQSLEQYLLKRFARSKKFIGIRKAGDWIDMASAMLFILKQVHEQEVVHGDIHPGNFLVVDHKPVLIDFGQSLIRDVEQYGLQASLYENDFTPPEKRSTPPTPWEQPADVFMLGMTLLQMAIGEVIPHPVFKAIKNAYDLRDDILRRFSKRNPDLLNSNNCLPHILMQALHKNPHDRATCHQLTTLLRSISRLNGFHEQATLLEVKEKVGALTKLMENPAGTQGEVLLDLLDVTVDRFKRKITQAVKHKRVEVSGDRNEIINHIILFLSHLKKGDMYWSLTHPSFWRPYNLGRKGRFYDFNEALALRGVAIRRLFLSAKDEGDESLKFARDVFEDHRNLSNNLRAAGIPGANQLKRPHGFYTGVLIRQKFADIEHLVGSGYLIGLARIGDSSYSLSFSSETSAKVMRRLAIERANKYKAAERVNIFCELTGVATPVTELDVDNCFKP